MRSDTSVKAEVRFDEYSAKPYFVFWTNNGTSWYQIGPSFTERSNAETVARAIENAAALDSLSDH